MPHISLPHLPHGHAVVAAEVAQNPDVEVLYTLMTRYHKLLVQEQEFIAEHVQAYEAAHHDQAAASIAEDEASTIHTNRAPSNELSGYYPTDERTFDDHSYQESWDPEAASENDDGGYLGSGEEEASGGSRYQEAASDNGDYEFEIDSGGEESSLSSPKNPDDSPPGNKWTVDHLSDELTRPEGQNDDNVIYLESGDEDTSMSSLGNSGKSLPDSKAGSSISSLSDSFEDTGKLYDAEEEMFERLDDLNALEAEQLDDVQALYEAFEEMSLGDQEAVIQVMDGLDLTGAHALDVVRDAMTDVDIPNPVVDHSTGGSYWSNLYDKHLKEAFEDLEEIGKDVVGAGEEAFELLIDVAVVTAP